MTTHDYKAAIKELTEWKGTDVVPEDVLAAALDALKKAAEYEDGRIRTKDLMTPHWREKP